MHTPVAITEEALAVVRNLNADVTVALGGGSTTGLGKAIALRTDLPQIVIPLPMPVPRPPRSWARPRTALKTTQRSAKVLPEVILYDVDLTLSLPPGLSATSGMNAIAHAVEALYAQDANPITSLMAEEAIRALAIALPVIVKDPEQRSAVATLSMAPGFAASVWALWAWRCITSFATPWAAPSIFPMPKPIPSSCRMPPPTMPRPHRRR